VLFVRDYSSWQRGITTSGMNRRAHTQKHTHTHTKTHTHTHSRQNYPQWRLAPYYTVIRMLSQSDL